MVCFFIILLSTYDGNEGGEMARPSRCRRICIEPEYNSFAPRGIKETETVCLTLDEFESIRLIDYGNKTQAETARQMDISRTTVAEIYRQARYKLADCLINGKSLRISGGNYRLCDGDAWRCCGKKCNRYNFKTGSPTYLRKEANIMKIAVTYENGNVFQHFGHTEQFKIYDIQGEKITDSRILNTNGNGHGALVGMLMELGVDTLICGGLGSGAKTALADAGIKIYGGVTGNTDDAVNALLTGTLIFNTDVHCDHRGHEHNREGRHCSEEKHGCIGNGSI